MSTIVKTTDLPLHRGHNSNASIFVAAMNYIIENIRKWRVVLLNSIKELSLEKMNKIPHGFNNNIIWNVGHLVAAQQLICYTKAGLNPPIDEEVLAAYRTGTKPERFFDSDDEDAIKPLLFNSLDLLEQDYQQRAFENYTPWTTRMGIDLNNIDEAIQYLQFHEGMHMGVIMSIKKLVQK